MNLSDIKRVAKEKVNGKKMEIWKPIKGFEEVYEVSNLGRIRSKDRIQKVPLGRQGIVRGKILKIQPNSRGYLRAQLYNKRGEKKYFFVKNFTGFIHTLY